MSVWSQRYPPCASGPTIFSAFWSQPAVSPYTALAHSALLAPTTVYEIRYRATYFERPWTAGFDPVTKKSYWFNRKTEETTFEEPMSDMERPETAGVGRDNPLTHAWSVRGDLVERSGKAYYIRLCHS